MSTHPCQTGTLAALRASSSSYECTTQPSVPLAEVVLSTGELAKPPTEEPMNLHDIQVPSTTSSSSLSSSSTADATMPHAPQKHPLRRQRPCGCLRPKGQQKRCRNHNSVFCRTSSAIHIAHVSNTRNARNLSKRSAGDIVTVEWQHGFHLQVRHHGWTWR